MADTTFLSVAPGKVVALESKSTIATVKLEAFENFSAMRAIITQVAISEEIAAQFRNMLGGNIYVYVFGEKPGGLVVRGIAMESTCDTDDGDIAGIKKIKEYYDEQNVMARKAPIKLTIGTDITILAYLTGVQYAVADPKLRLWEFTMKMVTIPASSIAANRKRASSVVITPPTTTPETIVEGPALPDPSVEGLDSGGGSFTNDFTALDAGSGYSTYGTGPNIDLVQAQQ